MSEIILLSQSLDFDKPFISNKLQVDRLIRRGVSMDSRERPIVEQLIKEHGYYQIINSYGAPFETEKSTEKNYTDNVSFSDIYSQFYLDRKLSRLLFNYILDIEEHFSNVIAYHVAEHFGVNNYLTSDENNNFPTVKSYLDESFYPNTNKGILTILNNTALKETKNPTSWYRKNNNHIPPWILFMNVTLGDKNRYYRILPTNIKAEIIDDMFPLNFSESKFSEVNKSTKKRNASGHQLRATYFFKGIELMRNFRNCIAHSSRVYAYKIGKQKELPNSTKYLSGMESKLFNSKEYFKGVGGTDLFALFIWIIICSPTKDIGNDFIRSLIEFNDSIVETALPIFLKESNLPNNYIARLKMLLENLEY